MHFQDDKRLSSCSNTSSEDEFTMVRKKGKSEQSGGGKWYLKTSNMFEALLKKINEEVDDDPININSEDDEIDKAEEEYEEK